MLLTVLFRAWKVNDTDARAPHAQADADDEDAYAAEEVSQMGRVLSLMIGPFALMIAIMSCLMKVMHIIIQDSHSNEWPRLRTAKELNGCPLP